MLQDLMPDDGQFYILGTGPIFTCSNLDSKELNISTRWDPVKSFNVQIFIPRNSKFEHFKETETKQRQQDNIRDNEHRLNLAHMNTRWALYFLFQDGM